MPPAGCCATGCEGDLIGGFRLEGGAVVAAGAFRHTGSCSKHILRSSEAENHLAQRFNFPEPLLQMGVDFRRIFEAIFHF